MSEAVTNAILHGSSSSFGRDPHHWSREESGALVFEVVDTGRFRPRVRRRGDLPESGRGLEFMRLLMDEVDLRPGADGTLLRLRQAPGRLSSGAPAAVLFAAEEDDSARSFAAWCRHGRRRGKA